MATWRLDFFEKSTDDKPIRTEIIAAVDENDAAKQAQAKMDRAMRVLAFQPDTNFGSARVNEFGCRRAADHGDVMTGHQALAAEQRSV